MTTMTIRADEIRPGDVILAGTAIFGPGYKGPEITVQTAYHTSGEAVRISGETPQGHPATLYAPGSRAYKVKRERVTTWADGFGVWHARVPRHCVAPLLAARRAIRDELQSDVARRCWNKPCPGAGSRHRRDSRLARAVRTYRGHDRAGVGRTGVLPDAADVATFVHRCFEQGWRRLAVIDAAGETVGEIVTPGRPQPRRWWAQTK